MKYSFVIPYYKRPQFWNTLITYRHFYSGRSDYEIMLLEDKKNVNNGVWHSELLEILDAFSDLPIQYRRMNYDNYSCPCSTINDGVDGASGKFVIMTNPECAHISDVLSVFDSEFAEKGEDIYVVGSCLSVDNYPDRISSFSELTYTPGVWYQHSKVNIRNLNFCTVMLKKNYIKIGGFNEVCDEGIAYADNHFIALVSDNYQVVLNDNAATLHFNHEHTYTGDNARELINRNINPIGFKSRFKR